MQNSGITLTDVRENALLSIKALREGKIEISTAKEIRENLSIIIDTARVQVDFLRAIPNNVKKEISESDIKAIAGTLIDRDAELDKSLYKIEENNNKY